MAGCALGVAALLSSCAPTLTASTVGRVVNTSTGEEGSVTFGPGALRARAGDTLGKNNVTVQVGGRSYVGRAALVDTAVTAPSRLNFSVGIGFSSGAPTGPALGLETRAGTPRDTSPRTRAGNLIVRTEGDDPATLTCTLQVDPTEHGVGDCMGSNGARYVMQF